MKKINRTQAAAKKPVAFAIQSTGAATKPKYEKPDYRAQLANFKKQNMPQAKPPKQSNQPHRVEIKAAGFNYTKVEPMKVEGWLIWKSVNGQLIAMPENKRPQDRFYPFELVDGILFLVNKDDSKYAYFHDEKFQAFLEKYGIHKVKRSDPNGEYQGRNDTERNTVSVFSFVTDGQWTEAKETQLRMDEKPIMSMTKASTFIKVENATFVLFEQIAYRQDDVNIEPFILRQLVSDYDIFSMEDEIAEACARLDAEDEEVAASAE